MYFSPVEEGTAKGGSHPATLLLTRHSSPAGSADGSQKAQDWGLSRVRPSLHGPLSISTDFWTQGNGHEATAHSPSKTETELSLSNKCCLEKKSLLLTNEVSQCERKLFWPEISQTKPYASQVSRKGKGGGNGWQSSKSLVLAITRWHLKQFCIRFLSGFLWINVYRVMRHNMILSPQQQSTGLWGRQPNSSPASTADGKLYICLLESSVFIKQW